MFHHDLHFDLMLPNGFTPKKKRSYLSRTSIGVLRTSKPNHANLTDRHFFLHSIQKTFPFWFILFSEFLFDEIFLERFGNLSWTKECWGTVAANGINRNKERERRKEKNAIKYRSYSHKNWATVRAKSRLPLKLTWLAYPGPEVPYQISCFALIKYY